MNNILLVDDDPDILEFVSYNLKKEGYHVTTASNGNEALEIYAGSHPDLVLLDVMMPGMDGIETCMKIREMHTDHRPIIVFLTARNEDYSQIAGLEAGGDDYIAKPIKPRVLISRIKAQMRRDSETQSSQAISNIGDISIDHERHVVHNKGQEVHLPRKQFNMLSLLVSRAGKVVSREVIMQQIWGDEVYVSERNIDVQIRKIREKIGVDRIKTIKGVGYKFIAEPENTKVQA